MLSKCGKNKVPVTASLRSNQFNLIVQKRSNPRIHLIPSFIHSLSYSFDKCVLIIYCVLGNWLNTRSLAVINLTYALTLMEQINENTDEINRVPGE